LAGIVSSGWSKNDGFKKKNQAKDRGGRVFRRITERSITTSSMCEDGEEGEVAVLYRAFDKRG
jgi:hypothetical protein